MPRHAREVVPGLPHHITTRANNRRRLFSYPTDYRRFIALIERGADKSGCVLHQLTLMSNHIHAIATPPEPDSLALLMHITCQPYAQHRNQRRNASGKLFEERFFSRVLESDEHVAAATLYADSNGFRARIATVPDRHRWSTCALHTGSPHWSAVPERIWTPSAWYESLGSTLVASAMRYRKLLVEYVSKTAEDLGIARKVIEAELLSSVPYSKRLERPDRSRAREAQGRYRVSEVRQTKCAVCPDSSLFSAL